MESKETMETPSKCNVQNACYSEKLMEGLKNNIILNYDFSDGLKSWHPICCKSFVTTASSSSHSSHYAVVTNRKECWQGLEQDITNRVSSGSTYEVSANVKVGGPVQGLADVLATLKLDHKDGTTSYMSISRTSVGKERWEKLEGTFSLSTIPNRVVFYLEGPSPGIELLIESVVISCTTHSESINSTGDLPAENENIILNPSFNAGLNNWSGRGCRILLHDSIDGNVLPKSGKHFASATKRTQSWNGIQQDVTGRVQPNLAYELSAVVRIYGSKVRSTNIQAMLWVQTPDLQEQYIGIAHVQATDKDWVQLQGEFLLNDNPLKVVVYLEGPLRGTDILLDSLSLKQAEKILPLPAQVIENEYYEVNVIANSNIKDGGNGWFPMGNCTLSITNGSSRATSGQHAPLRGCCILVSNRTQAWMGPAKVITDRIKLYLTYQVSAWVRIGSKEAGPQNVNVALGVDDQWVNCGQVEINDAHWHEIDGFFRIKKEPAMVIVLIDGPASGIDFMVAGLQIFPVYRKARFRPLKSQTDQESKETMETPSASNVQNAWYSEKVEKCLTEGAESNLTGNIILNYDFSEGLQSWHPNCCKSFVDSASSGHTEGPLANSGSHHAVVTNRKECWQGLEQDITSRVSPGFTYTVSANVKVAGPVQGLADVLATLKLHHKGGTTSYSFISRTSVGKEEWEKLEGTFSLSTIPDRVVFYLEGPSPGIDLLIKSVVILLCTKPSEINGTGDIPDGNDNIILNPAFDDGINNWSGRGCKILVHDSMGDGKILPMSGKHFASATERTQNWNGIQQDITGRVQRKLAYELSAVVGIYGNNVTSANVQATLWVQTPDYREQYIGIANMQATDKDWVQLQGKFLLNGNPSKVVVYLEGPPSGTDILLNSLSLKHAEKIPPLPAPVIEDANYGVNVIANSNLNDGSNGWFPLGNCTLSIATGSPRVLPPMARDSLGQHAPLSGRCILVSNRSQTWMGPAQMITNKIKLYLTYQVSAWVRIGSKAAGPQNVNVALGVDSQWVNGGQAEINDTRWHEIGGSFRIEKEAAKVMVYIQGPASGIDFMVAGLQIFPVDRQARFRHLKRQTDQTRKRDVILKFSGSDSSMLCGTFVKVRQTRNSFPFGSCISRTNIDNEDFVNFFTENFNWSVFGNELKWYWTESQQGKLNYKDADDLLNLCNANNIETRGHCIFWEVENTVQPWLKALNKTDLMTAVQNRLTGLLSRYKGKFKHYDVNNEMLHGSFYQDRLGKDIRANMFKNANQLDPSPTLFVNDYHIEDGCDTRSSPEKYIEHILGLQEQGAPVGGIGIQGHVDSPVGPIVCSALDTLGTLGLPIWFTELDVSSINEHIRADDLEVMLRECFAHPAGEGVMLWGFWELFMSRDNSHLVNAEGDVNEAGQRYLDLKKEWMTNAHGHIDEQQQFQFRGFQGTYEVELRNFSEKKKTLKTFVVDKGESPIVVSIDL